ncbi:unnamed protein product [Echinostoma caproni]|uniref:C3H1-type domain-containing protein n=1 Tax=Echinostoma caproni TaxID=27848 RepID=A0A3P8HFC7_9TREM|nr:unnamed protein product [Echinostoma caproni]
MSQYVIALIKKDKTEKELREICVDQLEVFLQENTSGFVEDLFAALTSRSYVGVDTMDSKKEQNEGVVHSRSDVPKEKKRSVTGESSHSDSGPAKLPSKGTVSGKSRVARSRSRSPLATSRTGPNSRGSSKGRRGRDSPERESGKSRADEFSDGKTLSSRNRRADLRENGQRKRRCRNIEEHGVCVAGSRCPFDHGPHAVVLPPAKTASDVITQLTSGHPSRDSSSKNAGSPEITENPTTVSNDNEPHPIETVPSIPIVQSGGEPLLQTPGSASVQTPTSVPILPVYRPTPINQPVSNPVPPIEAIPFNPSLLSIPPPMISGFTWPTLNLPKTFAAHNSTTNDFSRPTTIRHNVVPIPMRETNPTSTQVTQESADTSSATVPVSDAVPPAYEPCRPQITMISGPSNRSPSSTDVPWSFSTPVANDPPQVYTPSPISERLGPEPGKGSQSWGANRNTTSNFKPLDQMTTFPSVLYVTRIPWKQNDEDQLQEHFAKFGTVLKIIPRFNGLADAAMVEFSCPAEAELTYRSPEPILYNRFIRLSLNPPVLQRLAGRPIKYDFRGKTLQDRIGIKNRLGFRPYGGLGLSYVGSSDLRTKVTKSGSAHGRGHSRFRLERDPDALHGSPQASADETDEPDEERPVDEDSEMRPDGNDFTDRGFGRGKFSSRMDGDAGGDEHDEDKIPDASGVFGVELARARMEQLRGTHKNIHSTLYSQETTAYLWEHQKMAALKERQEKLLSLDKAREAKQTALEAQKQLTSRLRIQLKRVMAKLEGKDEPPSAPSSTGGTGGHLTVAEQRRLLTEAKRIQHELEQALNLEKSLSGKRSKPSSESDPSTVGSTTVSAAALQALPEPLATERRKQIAEVKVQLKKVESEVATLKAKGDPIVEQCRRILELKRQVSVGLNQNESVPKLLISGLIDISVIYFRAGSPPIPDTIKM